MRRDQRSPQAALYRAWYKTPQWKRLRLLQLRKQPLCERCLERDVLQPACIAHHKVPHRGNRRLFFDPANLASSCKPCHDIDEQRIERGGDARRDCGDDGWPLPPGG